MNRKALLVGSMPFENEEEAMAYALDHLGNALISVPDGEIGEKTEDFPKGRRAGWVMTVINACTQDTQNWEVARHSVTAQDGFPDDYEHVQKLRPKHAPAKMLPHLDFGYDRFFFESFDVFKRLRAERGLDDANFQVGIPTGLDITFTMMQPLNALRYADVFNQRIASEINRIIDTLDEDITIQIEVPGELALAYRLPEFLIGLALRPVFGLLKKINPSSKVTYGVHLCLGDLNNEALLKPDTLDKMVHFANKLVEGWPDFHRLAYMHFPLAEASEPPPLDRSYYQPLANVNLPEGTQFVAGFVHEKRTVDELKQLRSIMDEIRQSPVAVACSCGLGRRERDVAEHLIEKLHLLTEE